MHREIIWFRDWLIFIWISRKVQGFNEQGPAFWQVFVCVSIILIRYRNISGRVIKDDCSGFTTLWVVVLVRMMVDGDFSDTGITLHFVIGEILFALNRNITDVTVYIQFIKVTINDIGITDSTVCFDGWNGTLFDFRVTDSIVRYQLWWCNSCDSNVTDISVDIDGI